MSQERFDIPDFFFKYQDRLNLTTRSYFSLIVSQYQSAIQNFQTNLDNMQGLKPWPYNCETHNIYYNKKYKRIP